MSLLFQLSEDGSYYTLTAAGAAAAIIIAVLVFAVIAMITSKKIHFSTRQIAFSGIAIALAFVTSYIKVIHMPWGGSVTLCSMLFIVLIGFWYGPAIGFSTAFAYSMLQFLQGGGSYILSPLQVCLDYVFAFTALGCSGFFSKKKNGLLKGYIVSAVARGIFHSIGGYLFWMDYMPENFPASLAAVYPILYNFAYIGLEMLLTIIIISIPPVKNALRKVGEMAVS